MKIGFAFDDEMSKLSPSERRDVNKAAQASPQTVNMNKLVDCYKNHTATFNPGTTESCLAGLLSVAERAPHRLSSHISDILEGMVRIASESSIKPRTGKEAKAMATILRIVADRHPGQLRWNSTKLVKLSEKLFTESIFGSLIDTPVSHADNELIEAVCKALAAADTDETIRELDRLSSHDVSAISLTAESHLSQTRLAETRESSTPKGGIWSRQDVIDILVIIGIATIGYLLLNFATHTQFILILGLVGFIGLVVIGVMIFEGLKKF